MTQGPEQPDPQDETAPISFTKPEAPQAPPTPDAPPSWGPPPAPGTSGQPGPESGPQQSYGQQSYGQQPPGQQQPYAPYAGFPGAPYGASPAAPYGIHPMTGVPYSEKSKIVAGLLQILLPLGIGRFYIGDTGLGVAQLLVTIFTCGIGALWPVIDGIIILASDSKDANGLMLRS